MSRIEKIKDRFWQDPCPKQFDWADFEKLAKHYGFERINRHGNRKRRGGSSEKFYHKESGIMLHLHKPHPDDTLWEDIIKSIRERFAASGNKP